MSPRLDQVRQRRGVCLLRSTAPGARLQQPGGHAEAEPSAGGLRRRAAGPEGDAAPRPGHRGGFANVFVPFGS